MVIKVYISGISGNKEVKKRQQRVLMILESKNVEYQVIDITEPGKEADKEFMQLNSMAKDSKYPLPPQIFNGEDYCGDYEDFDEANEMDELEKFLKGPGASSTDNSLKSQSDVQQNGNASSREPSTDKDNSAAAAAAAADDLQGKRASETENDKLSDNVKHSGSETEIKDLSEDDGDLEKDGEEKPQDDDKDNDE